MVRVLGSLLVLLAGMSLAKAAPDLAKGEASFRKCMACHAVGPGAKPKVGPPLNGIFDRKWAQYPGYSYSQELIAGGEAGKVWDATTLDAYLANPRAVAPQGRMVFFGIKPAAERADLIAYLKQFDADGEKH